METSRSRFIEQDRTRLTAHTELLPRLESRVPQHGKRRRVIGVDEVDCLLIGVLSPEPDDLDYFRILASKLLDCRRLAPTEWSVGSPEPQKHRFVERGEEFGVDLASGQILDDHVGKL